MTELKLNSKTEIAKDASKPDRRIWITAVFAGLLMVTVLLGLGSSKKTNKPVTFDPPNQNSSTQAPATASSAPSTTSGPGMPAEPVAKKKPVRKRPATVTYVDDKYGVSFHYPRKYALKASDQTKDQTKPESSGAEPLPMNFIESGGVHVVSVELPGSLYQGTDFVSGIFNVSVNKSLTSEQCGQFATSQKSENGPVSPLKVNFRGMEFSQLETTTDLTDTRYYHRFENGGCYEFALGLKTAEHESVESGVPVDDHDVFARLEKILATVHIKSELVPELTAGELAGSAGASNSSNR